jgi:16S rRNA processing protein RimM
MSSSPRDAGLAPPGDLISLGSIAGLYGVRGWVKVYSHSFPRENILQYRRWYLGLSGRWQAWALGEGRVHGKGVVARLEGVDERDAAARLLGAEIAVRRAQFDPLPEGQYYWADLEGLQVVHRDGMALGVVDYLIETGANDVLVVRGDRERLIPFVEDRVVLEVDLDSGLIRVDWDPEY